jgi:sugar phosphate isomerase/epimerase
MKRRYFLQNLSLGVAALYMNGCAGGSAVTNPLALQLYTVRDAVAKDLEGTLNRIAELGYKQLEIYGYNGTFFGKTAKEFKSILDKAGIKIVSSHHNTGIAMKAKGTLTDGWDKAVEDIHELGAPYMVCPYLFPDERSVEHYKALPELLEKSANTAKAAGIQFAYHNHDFEFEKMEDTIVFDYLAAKTSADLVKFELDLYWISKTGNDPVKYFEKYPGRFPLWHVKDMEAGTKDITEVGNGTIDFDRIFAAREKAGLKHWFVEQDTSKRDMFESLKISRDYLAKKNY